MTLSEFKDYIKGKNVGVVGIGRSNMPIARLCVENGACVTARDKGSKEKLAAYIPELSSLGIKIVLGENYLDGIDKHDIIFKTPGIRRDMPAFSEAEKRGITVTSEMDLFFELCPCKIFAVTGSDGKTTTTTLIYEMLKAAGYHCHLGGNIGRPLLGDIENITPSDMAVVELSSFQLFDMTHSPCTAVITNLSPNHLDWHRDFNEYVEAKTQIFKSQDKTDTLVLNADNEVCAGLADDVSGNLLRFSSKKQVVGAYLDDGAIYYGDEKIIDCADIRLPGAHNIENYMAAIAAVYPYVKKEDISSVAENFGGVKHRMEFVCEKDGVKYYNDSIGTSPTRTAATLRAFSQKVILIAGGYDKHLSYDALGPVICDHVKSMVLVGATSDKIDAAARAAGGVKTTRCTEFESAVRTAASLAESGDIVLLSPASASFDLFRDFEERGDLFKQIVNSL